MADEHFYHTTETENLDDIRAQGLKPFRPSYRGEQDAWPAAGPDGKNTEPRVYLAGSASQTSKFQASGKQALLRVKAELLKDHPVFKERYTGDFFTRKRIKPEHLEVQNGDAWTPLKKSAAPIVFHLHKRFRTDEGQFSVWDTEKTAPRDRPSMFVLHHHPDGFVVRNAVVPESLRRQGLASTFYRQANDWSLEHTGNPLRSSPPRTLHTGETVHELSSDARGLWTSFVARNEAEPHHEGFRFRALDRAFGKSRAHVPAPDPIVAPAIRLHTGHVIAAPRRADDSDPMHGDAMFEAVRQGHDRRAISAALLFNPAGTGFVTRSGTYLSRRDAIPVVLRLKQLKAEVAHKAAKFQQQYRDGKADVSLDSTDIQFAKSHAAAGAMRLYHGSPHDHLTTFDRLAPRELESKRDRLDSVGTWFAETPEEAQAFTRGYDAAGKPRQGRVYATDVTLKNPKVYGSWQHLLDDFNIAVGRPDYRTPNANGVTPAAGVFPDGGNLFHEHLRRQGHDGLKVSERTGIDQKRSQTYWVALDPSQVKIVGSESAVLQKAQPSFRIFDGEAKEGPEYHGFSLEVMHPNGQQGAVLHLGREPHYPPGHWHLYDVEPVDRTNKIEGNLYSRGFANRLGPAVIRATARHLKRMGVQSVRGFRITGARFGGDVANDERAGTMVGTTLKSLTRTDVLAALRKKGRGDALQPYAMKIRKNAKLGEVDLDIEVTAPGPMRRTYNAPVSIVKSFDFLKARIASFATLKSPRVDLNEHQGLSDGGFRADPTDGALWYIKRQPAETTYAEHLSNQVYRALGHHAPHSMILHEHDGHPVYLSKHVEGFTTLDAGSDGHKLWTHYSPQITRKFVHGYAADALVGNQDLHAHNVGVVHGQVPMRIDNGITDLYTRSTRMRLNHYCLEPMLQAEDHHGIEASAPEHMRPHVQQITRMIDRHGGWQAFVDRHIPSASPILRRQFATTLHDRHSQLRDHVSGMTPLSKAIDYDALEAEYEPRPKKSGKGGKGSPVGSRTDQTRHQRSAYDATKARIEALKPQGVSAQEWAEGVKHESEHKDVAPSPVDQAKIAAVHLKEEPHYYAKLKDAGIK